MGLGYIDVKGNYEYIESINILDTGSTSLLESDFIYVPNNLYNELFKMINELKQNYLKV